MRLPHPRRAIALSALIATLGPAGTASARPPAPSVFCTTYPDAPICTTGAASCQTCHTVPPARNVYGTQLDDELASPLSADAFVLALPQALAAIATRDADGDGATNQDEIRAGTSASDAEERPGPRSSCIQSAPRPLGYDVCGPDLVYTFKKIKLDVCGAAPTLLELEAFATDPDPKGLEDALNACLETEHWLGRDGVLWALAHPKIRPIQALKSGARDRGPIPLADYDDDYNFFVHATSGDRDVRLLLTGTHIVERTGPTTYQGVERSSFLDYAMRGFDAAQLVDTSRRVGMLTQRWFLMSNTMFTALPRTTAAQAYRAYLGYDLSRLEGLSDVPGEPQDYDNKAVARPECSVCHATLDPLAYPFAAYEGIGGGNEALEFTPYTYAPDRLARFLDTDGARVTQIPEAGVLMGQPVEDLVAWGDVAANSDAFARTITLDFWRLLIGQDPRPSELPEFEQLWRSLRDEHDYRIERMLHDLIQTEAYRVP